MKISHEIELCTLLLWKLSQCSVLHLWKKTVVWEQLNNMHINKNEETDDEASISRLNAALAVLPSVSLSWLKNYYWTNQRKHNPIYLKCDVESTSFVFLHICCTISWHFLWTVYKFIFENEKMDKCHCLAFVRQSVKPRSSQKRLQWQLSFNKFLLSKIPAINCANKLLRRAMKCTPETILRSVKEHDRTRAPQKWGPGKQAFSTCTIMQITFKLWSWQW